MNVLNHVYLAPTAVTAYTADVADNKVAIGFPVWFD
jgi:uncharacterized membrane protein YhdT